jgi:hypothetical protein
MYENFWSDEIPAETVYSYGVFRGIVRMKKLHTFTAAPLSDIEDLRFDTTALSNVNLFGNCRDGSIKLERAAEHVTVTIGPEVEKIRVLNLYGLKMSQVTLNFNGENQNLQALANDKNLELRQLDNGHVYTTKINGQDTIVVNVEPWSLEFHSKCLEETDFGILILPRDDLTQPASTANKLDYLKIRQAGGKRT